VPLHASEDFEARLLIQWCNANNVEIVHVPNERHDVRSLGRVKNVGIRPGFPDYIVLLPGGVACFIELKRKTGRTSQAQKEWIDRLDGLGFSAAVCYGYESAIGFIKSELERIANKSVEHVPS